jgi:hypothetical protein
VIWFFQRADEEMRVITRFDRNSEEYVVEIEWPQRDKIIERYTDYGAFNVRVQRLHMELLESRWAQNGTPAVMNDGWRGPVTNE